MASASVHLAVLVIAKDPVRADLASGDVVATRAAAAGHRVISRQAVADSEAAVRSQLARWIDDREVDVVVVLGGGSPVVAKTLATLVTEPVPGTDVVRCGATFVFVVTGAAGPAMDKLILPQLDASTRPRNLLGQIPRLHAKAEGVPLPIVPEKTEGGSGVPARMPASVSTRAKQKTGANVISRPKPAVDPATKPIDLARLERQLEKSTTPSHDDVTRPEIALILPRVPPGATSEPDDDDDDDDDSLDDHTTTDTLAVQPAPPLPPPAMPRTRPPSVAPTAVPRIVPSVVKPRASAPTGEPKSFSFSTPLRGGPPSPPRERTSTGTPAYPPRTAAPSAAPSKPTTSTPPQREPSAPSRWTTSTPSKPVPSTPPPSAATPPREPTASGTPAYPAHDATPPSPRSSPPSTPPPAPGLREPWRAKSTSSGTPAYPASTTTPAPAPPTPPPAAVENPDADESWTSILAAAKAETTDNADNDESWAATVAAAKAEADAAAKAEAVIEPPPPAAVEEIAEIAEVVEVVEVAEVAEVAEVKVEAPLPARVRQPTQPPPVRVREPTQPPPARVRQPTPPPPLPVARPVRTPTVPPPAHVTNNDLPHGAFTYPDQPRRGNVVLKVVAAIGVTVLGFFAVVYFLDRKDAPEAKVASGAPATPIDPPSAGSATGSTPGSATPTGSAATEPEIEMDTGEPPPAAGSAAIRSGSTGSGSTGTTSAGTRPRPGTPTPRPPTTAKAGSPAGSADDSATPEPAPPPDPEFTEAALCNEANCVLSDYDRACCAKYKPKGPVISQRVGGVPQSLDRSMVRAGVDGIKPRVIACGEKARVQGTVKIAISVSPEGAVTGADVQDTPDAALGTCVAGALRSAKFGKSVDGGSFTYPFVF